MRKLRAAVEREFGEEKGVVDPGAIYARTGFHYYGHFIHADQTKPIRSSARQANVNVSGQEECPGDAIVIRVAPKYIGIEYSWFDDDRDVHVLGDEPRGQAVVTGFIRRLLTVEGNKYTSWIELEVVTPERNRNKVGRFLSLKRGPRLYIPLGWKRWTVARRIHLVPQPGKATTHVLLNDRIKWELSDRWPTYKARPEPDGDDDGDDEDEDEDDHGEMEEDEGVDG
jgi:hypothetical protein